MAVRLRLRVSFHHKNYMSCMKSNCLVHNRIICLLTLALFFLSSFPSANFMVQGRKFPEFPATNLRSQNQENAVNMRSVIGSMPPRCEERCKSCGHCEAVQVPIVPAIKSAEKSSHLYAIVEYSSRGDDISNYKPMCWKCKCGDFIFNP